MLGHKNRSYTSQVFNGIVPIPRDFGGRIKSIYPSFNLDWFETGNGSMLIGDESINNNTNTNTNTQNVSVGGGVSQNSGNSGTSNDMIEVIKESQRQAAEILRQTAEMQKMMMVMIGKMND